MARRTLNLSASGKPGDLPMGIAAGPPGQTKKLDRILKLSVPGKAPVQEANSATDPTVGTTPYVLPVTTGNETVRISASEAIDRDGNVLQPDTEEYWAPAPIYLRANTTGWDVDFPEEELDFEWDMGKPDKEVFKYGLKEVEAHWMFTNKVFFNWNTGEHVVYSGPGIPAGLTANDFLGIRRNIRRGVSTGIVEAPTEAEFDAAGTDVIERTYKVAVTNRGRHHYEGKAPMTATKTIRVTDPRVFFGTENTYYITSDPSKAPADAVHVYPTYAEAINGDGSSTGARDRTKFRIRFACGETHDPSYPGKPGDGGYRYNTAYKDVLIDYFGDPDADGQPALNAPISGPVGTDENGGYFMVWGLDLEGGYEADRPYETSSEDLGKAIELVTRMGVYQCNVSGFDTSMGTHNIYNAVVEDTYMGEYRNYGWFGQTNCLNVAGIGFTVAQDPEAVVGTQRDGSHTVRHGTFRFSSVGGSVCFRMIHNRIIGSWGSGIAQPATRMGGNGCVTADSPFQQESNIGEMLDEGGSFGGAGTFKTVVNATKWVSEEEEPQGAIYARQCSLYEQIWAVLHNASGDGSVHGVGTAGLVHRNNVVAIANTDGYSGGPYGGVVSARTPNGWGNADYPVSPHDDRLDDSVLLRDNFTSFNTFLDMRNKEHFESINARWTFKGFEKYSMELPPNGNPNWDGPLKVCRQWYLEGNVWYSPNRDETSPVYLNDGPFDVIEDASPYAWSDTNMWREGPSRTAGDYVEEVGFASGHGFMLIAPKEGSPAYQAAVEGEKIPFRDTFGNIRPKDGVSHGAVEPATMQQALTAMAA